jgi:hypothetical protein
MVNRPCKPDADLKWLWQLMLGTPFPACGTGENSDAAPGESMERDEHAPHHLPIAEGKHIHAMREKPEKGSPHGWKKS